MLVTPTVAGEEGKIHHSLPNVVANGATDLVSGLSVAGLALKHRQDKNQRQRAVVLLGSPLPSTLSSEELVRLGKRLKKNNVAVDVVLFGAESVENEDRMRAFVEAVNSGNNSTFVFVAPGSPGLLSDHIKQSEMLREEGFGGGPAEASGGGEDGGLDLDPNLDPELAMVRASVTIEAKTLTSRDAGASDVAARRGSPASRIPPDERAGSCSRRRTARHRQRDGSTGRRSRKGRRNGHGRRGCITAR